MHEGQGREKEGEVVFLSALQSVWEGGVLSGLSQTLGSAAATGDWSFNLQADSPVLRMGEVRLLFQIDGRLVALLWPPMGGTRGPNCKCDF